MTIVQSGLYHGAVTHRRLRPKAHALRYRVFSLLLDLDELAALDAKLRLFSLNRFNLFSFHDRDHGEGGVDTLRGTVDRQLRAVGIDLAGGSVRLLCYPRILGFVFNPLSVFYCHRPNGDLAAVIYEVSNTFGERHSYVLPVAAGAGPVVRQSCAKVFYVSPFNDVSGHYDFHLVRPVEKVAVAIDQYDAAGLVLQAAFAGQRQEISDRTLLAAFFRYPLMTVKIVAGIHWEALRLWAKGNPLYKRPAAPKNTVSMPASGGGSVVSPCPLTLSNRGS